MLKFYFYSVPHSAVPSPYFLHFRECLADISKKEILQFRTWQGTHEAPEPVTETPWHSTSQDWAIRTSPQDQG